MPGYLPPQGYKDPYKDSELTYRASLLPIGTYGDPNGGHDTLGMAWPGAITEPMNALLRLIGTPSNPGTFTQGPNYGSNADDMRTLLETFLGGNATRAGGEAALAARALSDTTPSLPGAVIAGAERNAPGFDVWHGSPHDFDQFDISKIGTGEGAQGFGHGLYFSENPSVAKDYQSSLSNDYGKNTRTLLRMTGSPDAAREWLAKRGKQDLFSQDILSDLNRTPSTTPGYLYQAHINANPADFLDWDKLNSDQRALLMTPSGAKTFGSPGWSYLDAASRNAGEGTRNYVVTDPSLLDVIHKWRGDQQLYSDQLPSLWGSALQGQQNQPYPNSLFTY